jgi:hypothetical protein
MSVLAKSYRVILRLTLIHQRLLFLSLIYEIINKILLIDLIIPARE